MANTPGSLHVRERTQQVRAYHHDEQQPGKPLHLIVPGALIALTALVLIVYTLYAVMVQGPETGLEPGRGYTLIVVLAFVYVGGLFLFSYGYELYDVRKAMRLTVLIFVTTFLAVILVAVVFLLIGASGSSRSGSGTSDRSGSGSGGSSTKSEPSAGVAAWFAAITRGSRSSGAASSAGGSMRSAASDLDIDINFPTRTVEKRVVERVEVPVAPQAIPCPSCSRSYVPFDTGFVCPACGAPTPANLVEASRSGDLN